MQLSENQTFVRNGYERQILTDNGKSVLVKTVGTPACRSVGRPPMSGKVKKRSFLKWLNSAPVSKDKKIYKIQLVI